jgi:hypothetical protein
VQLSRAERNAVLLGEKNEELAARARRGEDTHALSTHEALARAEDRADRTRVKMRHRDELSRMAMLMAPDFLNSVKDASADPAAGGRGERRGGGEIPRGGSSERSSAERPSARFGGRDARGETKRGRPHEGPTLGALLDTVPEGDEGAAERDDPPAGGGEVEPASAAGSAPPAGWDPERAFGHAAAAAGARGGASGTPNSPRPPPPPADPSWTGVGGAPAAGPGSSSPGPNAALAAARERIRALEDALSRARAEDRPDPSARLRRRRSERARLRRETRSRAPDVDTGPGELLLDAGWTQEFTAPSHEGAGSVVITLGSSAAPPVDEDWLATADWKATPFVL